VQSVRKVQWMFETSGITYFVSDETARGSRNVHLACEEAVIWWGIVLVSVSVARSMGCTLGAVSGDLQEGQRPSLQREVAEALSRNEGKGWMCIAPLARRFTRQGRWDIRNE